MDKDTNRITNTDKFYLNQAENLAKIGFYEYDLKTDKIQLVSSGINSILEDNVKIQSLRDITTLMRQADAKILHDIINNCKKDHEYIPRNFEHLIHLPNNKMKFISHTLSKDKSRNKLIGMLQNITNKYHNEREILKAAYYDSLTSFVNRSGFEKHLNLSIKLAENVHNIAIVFIDLDDFKKINDTLGHDAGDDLLKKLTSRISNVCDRYKFNHKDTEIILSDIVPSRFGGDEFVISVPFGDDIKFIYDFCQELLNKIKQPLYIKGKELRSTASIGVSCYPNDGKNFIDLLKKADTAMYRSKENYKNSYTIYNENMGTLVRNKLKIESKLIDAINNRYIELYYQPKISLNTAKITSFEVLIRWKDSERGIIYPSEFINIAEETDLILELTDYIMDKCYIDYLNFFKQYNLFLSINLSSRQLSTNLLSSKLFTAANIEPSDFEFEITEGVLIDDFDKTRDIINILYNKGFHCCIDDFGSGYSSFNYIKNLPIHTIKMDKTFIENISNPKDLALVKSIIFMANELNLDIVAEGVETFKQLDYLLKFGCNQFQGFLLSKAISLDALKKYQFTGEVEKVVNYIKNYSKSNQKNNLIN